MTVDEVKAEVAKTIHACLVGIRVRAEENEVNAGDADDLLQLTHAVLLLERGPATDEDEDE